MHSTIFAAVLIASPVIPYAGDIPADIWDSEKHGGNPAISMLAGKPGEQPGIQVVLPTPVLPGQDAAALTKEFLEREGPGMCSDIFDLTVPHKGLKVTLLVQDKVFSLPKTLPNGREVMQILYTVTPDGVTFTWDYQPSVKVVCIRPGDLVS